MNHFKSESIFPGNNKIIARYLRVKRISRLLDNAVFDQNKYGLVCSGFKSCSGVFVFLAVVRIISDISKNWPGFLASIFGTEMAHPYLPYNSLVTN